MLLYAMICFLGQSAAFILFEDPRENELRPRTFYLTSIQEDEIISRVLCEGYDCPQFTVVKDHSYFIQQRVYKEATFLSTTRQLSCDFPINLQTAMQMLNAYRNGSNEREYIYPKSLPLLIKVEMHPDHRTMNPWCRMKFTIGMYYPHYWGIPPNPTESSLKFGSISDGFRVFVHTFSGQVESLILLKEVELFRKNLENMRLCYQSDKFYVAIYDMPGREGESRDEIWLERCGPKKKTETGNKITPVMDQRPDDIMQQQQLWP